MTKPAVFLDRDGVITKETGKIVLPDETEVFSFAKEAIEIIHKKGYYAIVVSNQSGVARGIFSEEKLISLHNSMLGRLNLDKIYYCPHYEHGIVPEYSIKCNCRKPQIGMIMQACDDFEINMSESWVVGDRETDIFMGENAGISTCLVESAYFEAAKASMHQPDAVFSNVLEFAEWLTCAK